MKNIYLILTFLLSFNFTNAQDELSKEEQERRQKNIEAANPFKEFGYTPKIATLSKGKYLEVHDLDSIVKIGSFFYNVQKKEMTGYIITGIKNSEATLKPEIISRWLSPDPLAEEFPSWSPYNFVMNNPMRYIDPDGRMPIDSDGEFINEKGKVVGNDGKDDGKVYVIKTTQTNYDSDAPFAGITKSEAKATENFIKENSGNTSAFESNNIAYQNSVEIESSALTRQSMVNIVNQDDGKGGTSDANNREYGGVVNRDGTVKQATPGAVGNPLTDRNVSITLTTYYENQTTFHGHPSGTRTEGNMTGSWRQAPSNRGGDVQHGGAGRNYVFGRGNSTIYIYNNTGVQATIPQKYFVNPNR